MTIDLDSAPFELNLADQVDDDTLKTLGLDLLEQIEIDEDSRKEWMDNNKNWLKLASQVREDKSFPWPGSSNVKFPLLTIASMQFHSRALPNLINSNMPVRARVIGRDPDRQKSERAARVSKFMSFQVMEGMPDWLDDMDRLLFVLPMTGIVYKKTYFSEAENAIKSVMILPNDMIVNYYAQNFERTRMTQVLYMDSNEIYEYQAAGIFSDIKLPEPEIEDMDRNAMDEILGIHNPQNSDLTPYKLYESHCWLDLDDDGYKEPYIITLTEDGDILRIIARWSEENVYYNESGNIIRIVPDEYFTPFIFLPDPSSSVSGLGLGSLLGPINESVNTVINQLIDAGTLSTLQGGFLGRGVKLAGGATRFRPGEWKIVNSTGDDLRKNVFPMPIREPSNVLFELLSLLISSGERVSSVSDMMVGENPGQNQPASTTMAVLEQGLKIFSSVQKRIHRQLGKEYKIIYRLDRKYFDENYYNMVIDEVDINSGQQMFFDESDFELEGLDIMPASDPTIVSQAQKSVKSNALLEKLAMGLPLNVQEVTKRVLESEDQEDIPQLMNVGPPQPDPKIQLENMKFEHQKQLDLAKTELEALKIRAQAIKDETGAQLNAAKAEEIGMDAELKIRQQEIDTIQNEAKLLIDSIKVLDSEKEKTQSNENRK